jgi:MOSC domain-containing protein YiiM
MHAEHFKIFLSQLWMMEIKELLNKFPYRGSVSYISVRPKRAEPLKKLEKVNAIAETGLEGDRYKSKGGTRQVTLIQHEHLSAIASFLGKESIDAALTRRNIVVKGLNLLSLKGHRFKIGEAVFEYSGECHPCSRMEESLGEGGYNAMRSHGGITAKVVESGVISLND